MGYAIGPDFHDTRGRRFYVEASAGVIELWIDGTEDIIIFTPAEARKLADSVDLHLSYYEHDKDT